MTMVDIFSELIPLLVIKIINNTQIGWNTIGIINASISLLLLVYYWIFWAYYVVNGKNPTIKMKIKYKNSAKSSNQS